jgi:hypothetical protein
MDIATLVTAAIVSLHPHISGEMIDKYAVDIVAAVDEECGHDDAHCIELALSLVVIQNAESSFRSDIESCRVTGDNGKSVTGFQLQSHNWGPYSRKEICASNLYAARRAAAVLATHARRRTYAYAVVRYMGYGARDNGRCATLRRLKALPEVREALAAAKAAA